VPTTTARSRRLGLHLPLEVTGEDATGNRFREESLSRDVSGGGICFETRRHLVVGARLAIHIRIPPPLRARFAGRSVYRVRAVVCRVENFEDEPAARVGARFLGEIESE
jgi:hypothetical protein